MRDAVLKQVFDGHAVQEILIVPAASAVSLAFISSLCGIILDKRHLNPLRDGKKLRGPDILTPREFNQKVNGDGYVFPVHKTR